VLEARRATPSPKLDGILDDDVWTGQPLALGPWMSYQPLVGERAQETTYVWVAYDADSIYFAFRCLDGEPGAIRATVSRRDNVLNDDYVAVSLDSTAAGQVAYHMFVNPVGIQMDALNTGVHQEDFAADWVGKALVAWMPQAIPLKCECRCRAS
jgi:hypothetical protein